MRELHEQIVHHIEIVPFSEKVLSALEFRAPGLALLRQETLDQVAQALYRDAQFVPSLGAWFLRPALVQIDDAGQLLKDQLGQSPLVHRDEFGPSGQPA